MGSYGEAAVGGAGVSNVTSPVRSGTYALQATASSPGFSNNTKILFFRSRIAGGTFRAFSRSSRVFIRIDVLPTGAPALILFNALSTTAIQASVTLNTNGTLTLKDDNGANAATSTLALTADSLWHLLEFDCGWNAGSGMRIRVDGAEWISSSSGTCAARESIALGLWPQGGNGWGTLYFDDLLVDDDTFATTGFPGASHVVCLMPTAGNNANSWTGGAGGTGNISVGVDNIPPTGDATPADADQIKNAASGGNLDYTATMQAYTAKIPIGSTVNAIMAICNDAEEVGTNTKAGGIWCASNPAQGAAGNTFDYGDDVGAFGTFPSNWSTHCGPVAVAPSVTLTTAPTVSVRKTTSTTRVVDVDFMGLYVDYSPLTVSDSITVAENHTETLTTVGGNLSKSVSDSVSLAESVKAVLTLGSNKFDSISVAENVKAALQLGSRPFESITVSENVRAGLDIRQSSAESVTIQEFIKAVLDLGTRPSDSITVAEFVNAVIHLGVRPFETITVQDVVTVALQLGYRLSEVLSVAEFVKAVIDPLIVRSTESITVSEDVTAISSNDLATRPIDQITVSEAVYSLLTPLAVNASESITVTEIAIAALVLVSVSVEQKVLLGYKSGSDVTPNPMIGGFGSTIH